MISRFLSIIQLKRSDDKCAFNKIDFSKKDFMKIMSEPVIANYIVIMGWRLDGVIGGDDGEPRRLIFSKDGKTREYRLIE